METVFEGIPVTKRKPLREEVYQSLRKLILHGKLQPGQRLIEEKEVRSGIHNVWQDNS